MPTSLRYILVFLSIIAFANQVEAQQEAIQLEEFVYEKAPFKECHASTVAITPNGAVASWFGGTKEKNKDVEIWLSRKIDGKWTDYPNYIPLFIMTHIASHTNQVKVILHKEDNTDECYHHTIQKPFAKKIKYRK